MADYTAEVKIRLSAALATVAGVPQTAVAIEVEAGSVVVTATVSTDDEASARAAWLALDPLVNNAAALEAFLLSVGIEVSVTEPPTLVGLDPSSGSDAQSLWPGGVAAIVVASVGVLIALAFFVVFYLRRRSRRGDGNDGNNKIERFDSFDIEHHTQPPSVAPGLSPSSSKEPPSTASGLTPSTSKQARHTIDVNPTTAVAHRI